MQMCVSRLGETSYILLNIRTFICIVIHTNEGYLPGIGAEV